MRRIKHLVWIFVFLAAPNTVLAASHYIRAGAVGGNTGSDWTNAWASLPATLVRGDVYYVADGYYGQYIFTTPVSGSSYLTVKKATQADHGTDTGWSSSYGSGAATFSNFVMDTSYVIVDGQTGGGQGQWTTGFGFELYQPAARNDSHLVMIKHLNVDHITLRHINMHWDTSELPDSIFDTVIYGSAACNYCTISYSAIHDVPGTPLLIRNWDNFTLENSYIARNRSTPAMHSEGISTYAGYNYIFRYNWFEDIEGTATIVNLETAGGNWDVYGNVFYKSGNANYGNPSQGIVSDNNYGSGNSRNGIIAGLRFYNNTIIGMRGNNAGVNALSGGSTGWYAYNNLWYDCYNIGFANVTHDYNYYGNSTMLYTYSPEANGQVASVNPFVNIAARNFSLASPTNKGMALAPPYNYDIGGKPRGSDGNWDRGAYEYGGAYAAKTPAPPGGLTAK